MATIERLPALRLHEQDVLYPITPIDATIQQTWYVFRGVGFWFADTVARDNYGQDAIASVAVTLPTLGRDISGAARVSLIDEVCRHAEKYLGEA